MPDKDESIIKNGRWEEIESGSIEEIRDKNGFTHPNLYRRKAEVDESVFPHRNVTAGIYNVYSYRTTEYVVHDEESTTSEIP